MLGSDKKRLRLRLRLRKGLNLNLKLFYDGTLGFRQNAERFRTLTPGILESWTPSDFTTE